MTLVGAEVLKLVRRRGMMIWSALLTLGAVLVIEAILVILHAANPAHHGPAGGYSNFQNVVFLLTGLGSVAAIIIGATAGTQDVQNGVFRDLVVTGRSRSALFAVRAPGALLTFLPLYLVGFGVAIVVAYALAGSNAHPGGSDVLHFLVYGLLITSINVVIAIGLAAFTSSRVVVGVLIAWNAIVAHLLMSLSLLGGARQGIDVAAAQWFAPHDALKPEVETTTATAAIVLVVWAVAFLAAGRFGTDRRDA